MQKQMICEFEGDVDINLYLIFALKEDSFAQKVQLIYEISVFWCKFSRKGTVASSLFICFCSMEKRCKSAIIDTQSTKRNALLSRTTRFPPFSTELQKCEL
jgi:hypothetical protein